MQSLKVRKRVSIIALLALTAVMLAGCAAEKNVQTMAETTIAAAPDTSHAPDTSAAQDTSAVSDTSAAPNTSAVPDTSAVSDTTAPEDDVIELPSPERTEEWRETNVLVCRGLIVDALYDDAALLADELIAAFPDDPECRNLKYSTTDLIEWTGTIEHIFLHPLIAYPSRAFRDGGAATGQDLYMATVPEFKALINELYNGGYILVNFEQIFDFGGERENVKAVKRKLMLPEGKKPLVLSMDDVNYYEYMLKDGQVFKLVLDDGKVATYSVDEDGNEVVSRDNEVIPIIDTFVEQHPDFSYNNAKGVIGLTGYQGILGYRTNSIKYDNYESEREAVKPVVEQLRRTGWTFASHSQGHRHTAKVSYDLIVEDTDRYIFEVEPLVGYTPVYFYPFGEYVKAGDPKFAYLRESGFVIFCGVSVIPKLEQYGEGAWLMMRRSIDGVTLRGNKNRDMFDAGKVIDPLRYWYDDYMAKH